jgi:hypothetical protein
MSGEFRASKQFGSLLDPETALAISDSGLTILRKNRQFHDLTRLDLFIEGVAKLTEQLYLNQKKLPEVLE